MARAMMPRATSVSPQANLVGDEEAGRTVRIHEQAAESMVDGAALEWL